MTPSWVKDAVFYQIFPDRFRRGEGPLGQPASSQRFEPWQETPSLRGFKGGNLWGVVERLDYIKDQGFNALYFCPVFTSTANHRYHTSDYFQVDPLLGGNQALQAVIAEAHRRDMRVILDGVFNHCGRAHFAFQQVVENGNQSPYLNWFHVHRFPLYAYSQKPNYAAWWDNPELPKFNTSNPETREYLLSVAEYWLEQGIDGWRLDVPNEIDDDAFWQEFRRRVRAINPEAYIVGEIWGDAHRWLQGDQFDAVMNYPLSRAILGFVGGEVLDRDLAARSGLGRVEPLQALACSHRLEELFGKYSWDIVRAQMNILTSHDTPRIFTLLKGQVQRVKLALQCLYALPGAPTVYYGDEIGLEGQHDPDNRRGMIWEEERWQRTILDGLGQMARLRAALPALRDGRYQRLYAYDGHLAFARVLEGQTIIVTINASPNPWTLHVPLHGVWAEGEPLEHLSGQSGHLKGGHLEGLLAPHSLGVWEVR
jgi:glycosidase